MRRVVFNVPSTKYVFPYFFIKRIVRIQRQAQGPRMNYHIIIKIRISIGVKQITFVLFLKQRDKGEKAKINT